MNLRDKTIEDRSIVLNRDELTILGPGLVLKRCRIECQLTSRELVLTDVEMHDCVFTTKKLLTGYKFLRARFYDCAFEGTYSGCDFGKRAENYDNLGDIARCNFSKARLDGCRFYNCDISSLNLETKKPSILLPLPSARINEFDVADIAAGLRVYVGIARKQDPECSAIVDDIELASKRLQVTPADLLHVANRLGAKSQSS